MGSYTLLLLLGLGVALATAKPLDSTTTSPQLTSPKATETPSTTRVSPISAIPSFVKDHETHSPPSIVLNRHVPIIPEMAFLNRPYFPDQDGMQPWRDSRIPFIPIIPHERFNYEILNEKNGEMDKIGEMQTKQPVADESTPDNQDKQDMITIMPTDMPLMQEDESTVQQPKNDKIKRIREGEVQHYKMIKIPLSIAPIPIVGSRGINIRMIEPQYTMNPMEMQSEIRYGMPEQFDLSKRIRIENENPDEFMMRRQPMENSELDEVIKPDQEEQVEDKDIDMSENEEPDPEMSPEEESEQEPESEPEMTSILEAGPVLPSDEEPEMMPQPEQEQEIMQQPEQDQEMNSQQEPEENIVSQPEPEQDDVSQPEQEQEMVAQEEQEQPEQEMVAQEEQEQPEQEMGAQEEQEQPEQKDEPTLEQDQEPENISEEQEMQNKDELIMTKEQMHPQQDFPQQQMYPQQDFPQQQIYQQQNFPQDDRENMVEGYQDIWRGNMDIFNDSPDIPRMVW